MKVLFVCSWLDIKSKAGWFFVEQAAYIQTVGKNIQIDILKFQEVKFFQLILNLIRVEKIERIENSMIYTFSILKFTSENKINKTINKWFLYKQFNKLKTKYDILHAQSIFDAGYYTYLIGRKFEVPTLLTEHRQLKFLNSKFNYKTITKVLNSFKLRIVVSNEVIKQFANQSFFAEFKVINNPLDPIFYQKVQINSVSVNQNLKLVHIGAFTGIKDSNAILKLLKRLDIDGYNIDFTWIGYNSWGGDCRSEIESIIDKLNFSHRFNIFLFSRVDKQQLANLVQGNDLAICTSLCETFGIGNAECIAMGVPLLTTDNGGSREFTNSSNSVVVPICDEDALYCGFMQWYSQQEQFDKQLISDEIKKKLSYEVFANEVISEYKNILN